MIKVNYNGNHYDMADRYIGDSNVSKVYQGENLIWEKNREAFYYVFHSSTGIIDKVPLEDTRYFNEMVTPDTWYGGVAKEYVGKGTYATQIQNGDFSGLEFDEDGHLQDIDYKPYDGTVSNTSQKFVRTNMYQTRVTPEKNTLYFIVEVYKEFFVQGAKYGYDTVTRDIKEFVFPYVVDIGLYSSAGVSINGEYINKHGMASRYTDQIVGTINVTDINEGKAPRGYLVFIKTKADGSTVGITLDLNTYYEIIPTLTTADGIEFQGVPAYLYTADMTVDNIILSKEPFTPLNPNYLSFTAKEPSTVTLQDFRNKNTAYTMYYSRDLKTWDTLDSSIIVNLDTDERIYLKGNGAVNLNFTKGQNFVMTGVIEAHGNIMSLCYDDEAEGKTTIPGRYCFCNLFNDCASLITAPELPATTLTSNCYTQMFGGCRGLTVAPMLPATTLASTCYGRMFKNCTSLVTAPMLPATTLPVGCYSSMFSGCASLVEAPELPALIVPATGYSSMFNDCTNLNYIKMMATDISAGNTMDGWVRNVSPTGTFVKNSAATWNVTGASGIPEGWTVETADA